MQIRNLTFFFVMVSMTALRLTDKFSQVPGWDTRIYLKAIGEVIIVVGVSFELAWFFTRVVKVKMPDRKQESEAPR